MEHLHPKVLILFFVKNVIETIHILPIWFIAVAVFERIWPQETSSLPFEQIILLLNGAGIIFMIGLFVCCYYWGWYSFNSFGYALQPDGLHIYKGVFIKRQKVIPFHEIQTVDIYVNPIVMQTLGLYTLTIKTKTLENTAGIFKKSQTEQIPGLPPEKAKQLRNNLIKLSYTQTVKKTYFDPISGKYI